MQLADSRLAVSGDYVPYLHQPLMKFPLESGLSQKCKSRVEMQIEDAEQAPSSRGPAQHPF